MNIKLILLDLDFTFLNSNREIPQKNLDCIKRCQSQGVFVAFATSRGTTNISHFVELVQPDFVICNGGACIFQNGKVIHSESFSLEETKRILKKIYEVCGENAEITIDTIDKLYWNRKENKSDNFDPDALFDDMKDFKDSAIKVCVQTRDSEKAKEIATSLENCDFLPFSDIPWYKFSNSSATKENAIKFLTKHLNISIENTVAFGDDFSDIGMLKLCGKGIAMGNAIPAVKEIADEITLSCDENGVAAWLNKNIPEEFEVNGKTYRIKKLLGKGKGGYSYLACDEDGKKYVLKQIHHEPCSYYTFGNKIEAEKNDYQRLLKTGIRLPKLYEIDEKNERILKEYIDGPTVEMLVKDDLMKKDYLIQIKDMCRVLYKAGLNIDYYPTNFVVQDELLYYIDYECNEYSDQWNFENWGIKYWSKE